MRMLCKGLIGAALLAVLATAPALACKGKNVLLQDDFTKADPAWDKNPGVVSIGGGALTVQAKPNLAHSFFHTGKRFDKADLCVDVTIAKSQVPGGTKAGPIFLGHAPGGSRSYYWFWTSPAGTVGVDVLDTGKWSRPVPPRLFEGLTTPPGAKLMLRVTLDGDRATIHVGDRKIGDFPVSPVADGGFLGLAAAGSSAGETWSFSKLKVTDLAP
jgi:hypothetical protein